MDVVIEVAGAPEHDHPDREHEDEGKGCEHLKSPPGQTESAKTFLSFYDMPATPAISITMAIEPVGDAL